MATINEALKKLFLGLGGDPDELKDNNTVSDYIDDLESAIETAASGASADLIDDEEASTTKTYSSSKIASLIPENELPTPAVGDIGKVVSVVSDGESGAEYSLETPSSGGGTSNIGNLNSSDLGSNFTISTNSTKRNEIVTAAATDPFGYRLVCQIASNDWSKVILGDIHSTYLYKASTDQSTWGVAFEGILTDVNSGDLYQIFAIMGKTSSNDRLTVIPLTTT